MDSYAIATAIATRYSAANVTPPTGQDDPKLVTADLPEAISYFPSIIVSPPRLDDANYTASKGTVLPLIYQVTLLLSRADGSPRRAKLVHDWVTALYKQLSPQIQLGLAYVALAQMVAFRAGTVRYAGEEYDGITWDVRVLVSEADNTRAA